MSKVKVLICPYCGETQPAGERCRGCGGLFEPLSRQATLNAMGPWFIRDENRPFQPGCSYETLVQLIEKGKVAKFAIIRGPTTKQMWQVARRVPGIAHLFGYCHNCDAHVDGADLNCTQCGAAFGAYLDRNHMGLPDVNPLPWDVDEDEAASTGVFRQYFNPPQLQATGLSSFARDEELVEKGDDRFRDQKSGGLGAALGGSLAGDEAQHDSMAEPSINRGGTATATKREAATLADALPEFDSYAAKARQRALERRLAHQTLLVRIFIVLFFLAAGFAVALQLGWLGGADGEENAVAGDAGGVTGEATEPAPGAIDQGADTEDATRDDPGAGNADGGAAPPESQNQADDSTDAAPPSNPRDNRPRPYEAEHQRAMQLVKRSQDETRDIDERIDDVTHAVQILTNIRDNADRQFWPEGLELEIERQKRRIDELELSKFF